MRRVTVLIVIAALISGCATVQTQAPRRQTGSFPDGGKANTVTVGQVMITKYDYLSMGTATLLQQITGGFWSGRNGLNAGAKLIPAISSGQQVFCDQTPREGAPCVRDTDGDGRFDHAYTMNGFGVLVNGVDIPPASTESRIRPSRTVSSTSFSTKASTGGSYGSPNANIRKTSHVRRSVRTSRTRSMRTERRRSVFEVAAAIHRADNNQIEYTVESGF